MNKNKITVEEIKTITEISIKKCANKFLPRVYTKIKKRAKKGHCWTYFNVFPYSSEVANKIQEILQEQGFYTEKCEGSAYFKIFWDKGF